MNVHVEELDEHVCCPSGHIPPPEPGCSSSDVELEAASRGSEAASELNSIFLEEGTDVRGFYRRNHVTDESLNLGKIHFYEK